MGEDEKVYFCFRRDLDEIPKCKYCGGQFQGCTAQDIIEMDGAITGEVMYQFTHTCSGVARG